MECKRRMFVILFVLLFFLSGTLQQLTTPSGTDDGTSDSYVTYNSSYPYCFRFTWLGPTYDETSNFNGTCDQLLKDADNIPCKQPLVVTNNGTAPNIDYMWEHYRERIICRMASGQVCATYTYSYNGQVQNATYMCTKVTAVDEGAVSSGCYEQEEGGYVKQVCACKSGVGPYKPCNSATHNTVSLILIMLSFAIVYFRLPG